MNDNFSLYLDFAEKISQIVLVIVATTAAVIAFRQVRTSSTLELFKILQDEKIVRARSHVIRNLESKPLSQWDEVDYGAAQDVSGAYNIVGVLLKSNFASRSMFIERYCSSIQRTYRHLQAYRADIYHKTNQDPYYWEGYEWLYSQACRLHDLYPDDS